MLRKVVQKKLDCIRQRKFSSACKLTRDQILGVLEAVPAAIRRLHVEGQIHVLSGREPSLVRIDEPWPVHLLSKVFLDRLQRTVDRSAAVDDLASPVAVQVPLTNSYCQSCHSTACKWEGLRSFHSELWLCRSSVPPPLRPGKRIQGSVLRLTNG
jgi:hypothetical protein